MMDNQQPHIGILLVSAFVATTLQLVVAPVITIFGVVPNFILVTVIITALRNGPVRSILMGFLLGLVYDFCSLGPFGAMTLVLTLLAFTVSSLNKGDFSGGIIMEMIILIVAISLGELLVSVIYAVVGVNPDFLTSLVQRVLPAIVYDTIIGCILLFIYNSVQRGRSANYGSSLGTGRSLSRKLYR